MSIKSIWDLVNWGENSPYDYAQRVAYKVPTKIIATAFAVPIFAKTVTSFTHGDLKPFMDRLIENDLGATASSFAISGMTGISIYFASKAYIRSWGDSIVEAYNFGGLKDIKSAEEQTLKTREIIDASHRQKSMAPTKNASALLANGSLNFDPHTRATLIIAANIAKIKNP